MKKGKQCLGQSGVLIILYYIARFTTSEFTICGNKALNLIQLILYCIKSYCILIHRHVKLENSSLHALHCNYRLNSPCGTAIDRRLCVCISYSSAVDVPLITTDPTHLHSVCFYWSKLLQHVHVQSLFDTLCSRFQKVAWKNKLNFFLFLVFARFSFSSMFVRILSERIFFLFAIGGSLE